jgi:putative Mn2+ efflux pump MntP
MSKKVLIYAFLGCLFVLIWIEQVIADINKMHWALNSWISFIILLLPGIFFIESAVKQRKKEK